MGPRVDPLASDEALPARSDVVVVGGGIIGASTALFLARKGVSVTLCEKGAIGAEQSSRNWGWCRKTRRDPRELPLIIESMKLWESMETLVEADVGFRRRGALYAFQDEAVLARHEDWMAHAKAYQLDTRLLAADEVSALLPGVTTRFVGGVFTPSDGYAEPGKAAPAIAAAAQRLGAAILTNCAVRGIEHRGGRVAGAVTEKGTISCDSLVLAGGAWSRLFCGNLGLRLPQLKVLASVMRTSPIEAPVAPALWTPGFGLRKRLDGGYTVADGHGNVVPLVPDSFRFFFDFLPALKAERRGVRLRLGRRFFAELGTPARFPLDRPSPFEAVRILDPAPLEPINRRAKARLDEVFPVFKEARIAEHWAGLIDVTPDAIPVISPVEAIPGLLLATGFSGHGFGIGPAAGRLAADLVTGDPPIVDPGAFRFSRFTDGSRPRPQTGF